MASIMWKCEAPGLFRLILALLVYVHHATRFNVGGAAVYIFFILSGFWISTMWAHKYSRASAPYLTYSISRMWRLLPVFSLCSAVGWSLLYIRDEIPDLSDNVLHQVFSNLFMIGYNSLSFKANGAAWSLDIEAQFYVIAPLLVFLMARSLWTLVASAAISLAAYLFNAPASIVPYVVFFCVGIAAARSGWKPGRRLAWASLLSTVALVLGCVASPYRDVLLGGAHRSALFAYNEAACVILTAVMIPWALHTTTQKTTTADGMYADLSYIVYLLHWPILAAFNTAHGSYITRGISILESFVVVMIASWIIWRFFDKPINRLRSQWVARRMPLRSTVGVHATTPGI